MLDVIHTKCWRMSITGGGPDQLGGEARVAQDWFQLPDLDRNTGNQSSQSASLSYEWRPNAATPILFILLLQTRERKWQQFSLI